MNKEYRNYILIVKLVLTIAVVSAGFSLLLLTLTGCSYKGEREMSQYDVNCSHCTVKFKLHLNDRNSDLDVEGF